VQILLITYNSFDNLSKFQMFKYKTKDMIRIIIKCPLLPFFIRSKFYYLFGQTFRWGELFHPLKFEEKACLFEMLNSHMHGKTSELVG